MKIITANVNGIRSAAKKGFFEWLASQRADFVCLQETKAQLCQLTDQIFSPEGYQYYCSEATKPGYSGVAIYSKHKPLSVVKTLGWPIADQEGRYIQLDFPCLSVASLYLPSGTSSPERQAVKFDFLRQYEESLKKINKLRNEWVICGDWNIVHKEIDIKNFKSNQKNSGCLPEERAWMDKVFTKIGLIDGFRVFNQAAEEYTWWSNRGQAWTKNVGWRIDYQVITAGLAKVVKQAEIYKKQRFSDHAPVVIEYEFSL
ncbi:MAG: exodeoxyribonuclease III [Gammaproteobacteria bacterium RIFCSPHIGHO2_12_FULL_35_23]|nr:MAG: exodeoxyribonuclease III [Gammaproteobacteria bacterium RIFCSPHIGHO2_12_FULL_35_23]